MISSLLELQVLSTDVPMWLLDVAHASLDFAYLAQQVVCGFEFGPHIAKCKFFYIFADIVKKFDVECTCRN